MRALAGVSYYCLPESAVLCKVCVASHNDAFNIDIFSLDVIKMNAAGHK